MATYPYDFFKTDKNLSLEEISSIINNPRLNISILKNYEVLINDYIRESKKNMPVSKMQDKLKDLEKFKTLEIISRDIFTIKLKNNLNIFLFSKELILTKYQLIKYNILINKFLKLKEIKLFSPYLIHTYRENLLYRNPVSALNILDFDRTYITNKIYIDYDKDRNKLKKIFDVLFHGDYINLSLPSIGAMSSYIEDINLPTSKNFVNFIKKLLDCFSDWSIYNYNDVESTNLLSNLPILELDIHKVIAKVLTNNNENHKFNLPNNFSLSNLNSNSNFDIVKLIENNISGININLFELMFDVKAKKIKPEFLIPYQVSIDKIDPQKNIVIGMKKSETSSKLKSIKDTIKHNFDIFYYVFNNTFNSLNPIMEMEQKNYKNVLACLLFFVLNIVYEIQKEYIKKINDIIIDFSQSSNKKFGKLNIENGFEFMKLLNKSLYKFRLVLFNNFYHLFIPGQIKNNIYGMKKNEAGCYRPDAKFLSDNEYIFNNYPFNNCNIRVIPKTHPTPNDQQLFFYIDKTKLSAFLTTIKSSFDVQNKSDIVELGGFAFGEDITMKGFNTITSFFKLYYENCNFSIFVIDLLFKNFTENKKVIREIFSDIINEIPAMRGSSGLNPAGKDILINKLINFYSNNLSNSTKLLLKLNSVVKKIKTQKINLDNNKNNKNKKNNKEIEANSLFKEREILKLSATLYYFKAAGIDVICKNYISDIKLKNTIINKFAEIKKENETILTKQSA
jgi:hypothetical protein